MDNLLGSFASIVFFLLIVVGIILAVQTIIQKYWCYTRSVGTYEQFAEEEKPDPFQQRIDTLVSLKETLTADLDTLDDNRDASCNITKQVEDSYVSNNAAPTDESEYSMPKDVQETRQRQRNDRAKKRFEAEKKRYSELQKVAPVHECFATSSSEDELRSAIEDVERLIESVKMNSLQSLLGFNAVYLKKGAATVTESFANAFSGLALLAKADEVIKKGNALHAEIGKITAAVKTQQAVAKGVFQKTSDLQKGQVNASDVAAASSKAIPS